MKKYLLGFFAIVIAIGMSAFTTVKESNTWIFYQLSEGNYSVNPGSATLCDTQSDNPCTITYDEDPLVTEFVIEERPDGGTDSATKKLFE